MNRAKEVAKFASGAEAFHALMHTVFALAGTTITVFGITWNQTWMLTGVILNTVIAVALGIYAWGHHGAVTTGGPPTHVHPA